MSKNLCLSCMTENLQNGKCSACGTEEAELWGAPHHLKPRTLLGGKYLVGKVLGEGGFGITYVGWDTTLSMKVAIKEYYPNGFVVSRDTSQGSTVRSFTGEKSEFYDKGCKKFMEEAQRLARFFGLPGIVSVKDFFTENGTAYIIMEFVEGTTLRKTLESADGTMPEDYILEIMKPLIKSLAHMHKTGLIHRDIAPDNIILQPDDSIKLLDFGAAREASYDGKSTAAIIKHGYAPEEQYDSDRSRQGSWTDVYALCATIFRAIEGKAPPDAISRLRKDTFAGFTVSVNDNTRRVIMKGLALAPEDRWQNLDALAAELYPKTGTNYRRDISAAPPPEQKTTLFSDSQSSINDEVFIVPPAPKSPKQKTTPWYTKPWAWATGAALIVVAVVLIIVLTSGSGESPDPSSAPSGEDDLSVISSPSLPLPTGTELNWSKKGLRNISALAEYPYLETLYLDSNNINDIGVLSGLTNLAVLNLSNNNIDDITALSELTNMTSLYLYNNNIYDTNALSELTNLTELHLYSNNISDISALGGLYNLTTLKLQNNNISDISALMGLTNLTELYLQGNPILEEQKTDLYSALPGCNIHF